MYTVEVSMFIDRKNEMEQLNQLYNSDRAELFVLYGRRQVGKNVDSIVKDQ